MFDEQLKLILHPVRMSILTVMTGKRFTVQQLTKALPDIPQATLYRHVNALVKGNVLTAVESRQVRGTVEKTYGLLDEQPTPQTEHISKEEHMRYFIAFAISMMDDFAQYLEFVDAADYGTHGVGYRKLALYLSDDELRQLAIAMVEVLSPLRENKPSPERVRRVFSTVLLPSPENNRAPE